MQRYAYIKNGDPIDQIEELAADARGVPRGGPNAFLADLLRLLRDKDLIILSGVDRNRQKVFGRVSVRTFASHLSKGNFFRKAIHRVTGVMRLGLALYRFKPDVVICGRTRETLWLAWVVAGMLGAILIHSRHNRVQTGEGRALIGGLYSRIDGLIIRRCDAVVCHGPYLRDQLIDLGVDADHIFEFDSGFSDFTVPQQDREEDSPGENGRKTILFVGRVERTKGVVDLFEAMLERLSSDGNIELVYVGDGGATGQLRSLVASHGLEGRVVLTGRINHERLPALLAKAYMLVIPTRSSFPEGRCMSVMEGLVMGLPVIAPDFGPFPYLVRDGVNGLLYQPDSVEQLCRAINRLLDDENLHGQLTTGARTSGEELKNVPAGFADAINAALTFVGQPVPAARQ